MKDFLRPLDHASNVDLAKDLQKTNHFAGTHGGRWWVRKSDGTRWFLRQADAGVAKSAVLASMLFGWAGVLVPEMVVLRISNKIYVASREVNDAKPVPKTLPAVMRRDLVAGMAIDALTANRDVVGPQMSNVVASGERLYRIDLGGCFRYTGLGVARDFPPLSDELEYFRDAKKNPTAAALFDGLTDLEEVDGISALLRLPMGKIRDACDFIGDPDLFGTIASRRYWLLEPLRPVVERSAQHVVGEYKTSLDAKQLRSAATVARTAAENDLKRLACQLHFMRVGGVYDTQRFSLVKTSADGSIKRAVEWLLGSLHGMGKKNTMSQNDKVELFLDFMSVGNFNIKASEVLVSLISSWAGSSASSGAAVLKVLVHALVGNEDWHRLEPLDVVPHSKSLMSGLINDRKRSVEEHCKIEFDEMIVACKAMIAYNSTIVGAVAGKEVRLHRGMRGASVKSYGSTNDKCFEAPASILSSFSSKESVCRNFGNVVISVDIPCDNVFCSHLGMQLYGGEHEFIVISPRCNYSLMPWEIKR